MLEMLILIDRREKMRIFQLVAAVLLLLGICSVLSSISSSPIEFA